MKLDKERAAVGFLCDMLRPEISTALSDAQKATLLSLIERLEAMPAKIDAFEEEIKHTSHRDGLGMGDQRSEGVCRDIKDILFPEAETDAD